MSVYASLQGTLTVVTKGHPPFVATALTQHVLGHETGNFITAITKGGRIFCACDTRDDCWYTWDLATKNMLNHSMAHDGTGACLCPVTRAIRRSVAETCPVQAHIDFISVVAFSRDGQLVASGDDGGKVIIWGASSAEAMHVLSHTQEPPLCMVSSVSFSSNGLQLVTGCYDQSFCVWDTVTGTQLWKTLFAHDSSLLCVDCSPTNPATFLSVGSGPDDRADLKVWDIQTQQLIRAFPGAVFGAYSPDGRRIATVNGIRRAHVVILDATHGRRLFTLGGHDASEVTCGCFSPDGKQFALGTDNGDVRIWGMRKSTAHFHNVLSLGGPKHAPTLSVSWERDWFGDTQAAMAFAMGHHPRLGARSRVIGLDAGVNSTPKPICLTLTPN
jgi:WD40 repeat protein